MCSQKNPIVWNDKNFEAIIRLYLNNQNEIIYVEDLDDITELKIVGSREIQTNIKKYTIPKKYESQLNPITSMKDIDNFNNLKKITLCSDKIDNIPIYKHSSNIVYLNLSLKYIKDMTNIKEYNNLMNLHISDSYIKNLKPLNKLKKLKILSLSNIGQKADNIDGCIESNIDLSDLENLKNLENLENLYIQNAKISNASKFNKLNNLNFLTLFGVI